MPGEGARHGSGLLRRVLVQLMGKTRLPPAETIRQKKNHSSISGLLRKPRDRGCSCLFSTGDNLEKRKQQKKNPSVAFFNKGKKFGLKMGRSCLSMSV